MIKRFCKVVLLSALAAPIVGCETKAGTGALIGGAGGAAAGAIIGNNSHHRTGSGALIGGAVGAIGGGLVGHAMDKSDEKKQQQQANRDGTYDRSYESSYSRPTPSTTVTRSDVIDWSRQGVKDDIIIDRIQRSGTTYNLTSTDERQLRDSGVTQPVIDAMRKTQR